MFEGLHRYLFLQGLAPHGYCLLWDPALIWTHVLADAVIAAAYFSIPIALWLFIRCRRDIEMSWILALFAAFILACGTTHVLSILVLWVPAYGLEGAVKALTALVSIGTAIALWPMLPKLVALPSPRQLQLALDQLKAEVAERERAEEMLRQSHKLQAVGQLSAGIAHDFNNLLTVISGNLERALRVSAEQPQVTRSLTNALAASERAATLTGQLLAFARKQPLSREEVDLNAVVRSITAMLERTMGEHIVVSCDLAPDLPLLELDRSQLESAILNIALNARDAMDGALDHRGELHLSTRALAGGEVALALRDTGCGMAPDTLERATEPFFTTKPVGSGTGLGLSQVYGFVTQTGGRLEFDSTPGTGTVVRLLFAGQNIGNAGEDAKDNDGTVADC
ncbi:ATP-binding protein [Novosphingobium sp. MMS21-SN21R]|uniref:sensor histidine kinase n=1 Tax=Novosphingobium sp. MMS21-SN21R TaxID=2969298 RepID=UPI0028843D71|nr:ATP-binding protein [Novosphingobium sp. MMS21-SN21R]MDT0509980.1 ATP-binding protein [Novosphingobium sp. MMS21-SN21R]